MFTNVIMLHVTTEVGKPGFQERERRHFPDIHNKKGVLPSYKPHGRRYIPHGYGIYQEWRPHPQNIQMDYSEAGPDWKSRIKYIPDPENPRYPAAEIFENNWHAMRPYPYTYMRTSNEWLLDPGLSNKGMRCTFNGEHLATKTTSDEITHKMLFGQGRNLGYIDKRNGIGQASPGDKNYQVPEYSPGFHNLGSSLPIVEFGYRDFEEPYKNVARRKERDEEVKCVKALDNWRPATPLKPEKIEEKK